MQVVINPIDVTLKFSPAGLSHPTICAVDGKDETLATFYIAIIDRWQKQLQLRDERTGRILSVEVEEIIGNDFQIVLERLLNKIGLSHAKTYS